MFNKTKLLWAVFALLCISSVNAFSEEHIVIVKTDYDNAQMFFEPKILKIKQGDTVTWRNDAEEMHNMITYPDGYPKGSKGFASPYLTELNQTWSHTFESKGTYNYHCIPHIFMGMRGTIIVESHTSPENMNSPSTEEMIAYRNALLEFFDEDDFTDIPEYVRARRSMLK